MVKRLKQFIEILQQRNILKDTNFFAKDSQKIYKGNIHGYVGFDPTAPNIHFGNYLQIITLLRGGATGYIGDPSGKLSQRKMLDEDQLENNKQKMIQNIQKISYNSMKQMKLDKDIKLQFIDNKDFYKNIKIKMYLIQNILIKYSKLLIFFIYINNKYCNKNCVLQIGGSDQWGNINSGLDLLNRNNIKDAVGITTQLLLNSTGQKFGKSENNPIWINEDQQDLLNVHQYLINQSDDIIEELFKKFTFLDIQNIKEIIEKHNQNPDQKYAQFQLSEIILSQITGCKQTAQKIINYKQYFLINFEELVFQKEKSRLLLYKIILLKFVKLLIILRFRNQ